MKNISGIILLILIGIVIAFYMFTFQVRETESALVTTFGKPTRSIVEPGLYMRWPAPIQSVHSFDSRAHVYEGIMEETTTKGGEPIIVTSYVVWNIHDPLRFLESVRDKKGAELQLRSLLRDTQNSVIGRHYFSEFVNSNPEKINFTEIEKEMLQSLGAKSRDDFGINVRLVGIKQLGVSEKVTKDVFDRMRADRNRKTEAIKAEGNAEATRIRTDAESKRTELLAVADAQAKAIRGQGDAEAAKYYKLLEADPELAMFLRDLEALKIILNKKSTVVLGADTEPFELLKKVPDLEPKDAEK